MTAKYQLTWDLDSIYPGGSASQLLRSLLDELEEAPARLRGRVGLLRPPDDKDAIDLWWNAFATREELEDRLGQARAFIGCLMSQNVDDAEAKLLAGRVQQLIAGYQGAELELKDRVKQLSDESWGRLLADERFQSVAYQMEEMRDEIAELLPTEQEALIVDLAVDGYRAWERLYYTIVGRVSIPWEANGRAEKLSAGQAYNRFADPDPEARARLFDRWTDAWQGEAELCAVALNRIAGFRLAAYKHRGWDSVLARALKDNRMSQKTLDAMWDAVGKAKGSLLDYFKAKAELLGLDSVRWCDETAPINAAERRISYDEACDFVVDQFGHFSPGMAEFARDALESRWVEAEDRPAKGPGGYCTKLPVSKQSRIFMTFSGTTPGTFTLAHELGHAYHNHVQRDLPALARGFTMCTAETASTFAETIVSRAALAATTSVDERLALLDGAIHNAVAMFMNIHARFLFEQRLYDARKKGLLGVEQLNSMMEEAQREAYRDGLAVYHPQFWASKGHFYGTGTAFYNFPYTFGFLFSAGIYARARAEGASFADSYVGLLRDTGRMGTEELARQKLAVDLEAAEFWNDAVNVAMEPVQEFLQLRSTAQAR